MTAPGVLVVALSVDELRALVREVVIEALTTRSAVPPRTPLLDKRALAHALAISAATVTRMTAEGMPHVFVGASPRYALDEVRAWLDARGRRGTRAGQPKAPRETIAGVRLLSRRERRAAR